MDRFDGEWYDTPRGYDGPFHVPGDDVNPNDYFDSVQWHQDEDLMRRQQDDAYYGHSRQSDEDEDDDEGPEQDHRDEDVPVTTTAPATVKTSAPPEPPKPLSDAELQARRNSRKHSRRRKAADVNRKRRDVSSSPDKANLAMPPDVNFLTEVRRKASSRPLRRNYPGFDAESIIDSVRSTLFGFVDSTSNAEGWTYAIIEMSTNLPPILGEVVGESRSRNSLGFRDYVHTLVADIYHVEVRVIASGESASIRIPVVVKYRCSDGCRHRKTDIPEELRRGHDETLSILLEALGREDWEAYSVERRQASDPMKVPEARLHIKKDKDWW